MAHVFLYRGQRLPVSNMFDEDGDEVDDPGDAEFVICQLPGGEWLSIRAFMGWLKEAKDGCAYH